MLQCYVRTACTSTDDKRRTSPAAPPCYRVGQDAKLVYSILLAYQDLALLCQNGAMLCQDGAMLCHCNGMAVQHCSEMALVPMASRA